jgi:indolepyruvate ferredoxin oxidoreductase
MAGLAQKGGAVFSYIRIANTPDNIHAIRVAASGADLVLGGDIVVVGAKKVLSTIKQGNTRVLVNTAEFLPGDFTRNANYSLPTEKLKRAIASAAGRDRCKFVDASRIASDIVGRPIATNLVMLGYAYQNGTLPLSAEAIEKAIELNGEAVDENIAAFRWGRRAAADPAAVEALMQPKSEENDSLKLSQSFAETVDRRAAFLTGYQNAAYARRYRNLVEKVRAVEAEKTPGQCGLAEGVARYLFKLMAYKDEYEVARLYSETSFLDHVRSTFDGNLRLEFHLAPPLLARRDPQTGEPKKMSFGPWMMKVFSVLAKFKFLRGTPFDPFGYTAERRLERELVADYEKLLGEIFEHLTVSNHRVAVELAMIPEKIRGFGPVKERHLAAAKAEEAALREQFRAGGAPFLKAAE